MRNGVIAVRRDGTLALMNDEAYRIFSMARGSDDVGRPFTEVLRTRPDISRVLVSAFELSHLPNRVELRLKDVDRVIGYTLSQVKDDDGQPIGAVMYFKDLTRVEQLEERERLRDRLASLGEMAAGIAHELKNPLAGIEVMAGLLRCSSSCVPSGCRWSAPMWRPCCTRRLRWRSRKPSGAKWRSTSTSHRICR
jgi:nitrogen-specific signal transduction histidine kinase